MAVNQIVLELKGRIHEKVARDAFRLAGEKLPGKSVVVPHARSARPNVLSRTVGIRQERCASRGRDNPTGWRYVGRVKATEEESRR